MREVNPIKIEPIGLPIPKRTSLRPEKLDLVPIPEDPLQSKESECNMNTDKITTVAGGVATVCTGVLGAVATGVIVVSAPVTGAIVVIGTVSGLIFSFFTNKPSPFQNPIQKKNP